MTVLFIFKEGVLHALHFSGRYSHLWTHIFQGGSQKNLDSGNFRCPDFWEGGGDNSTIVYPGASSHEQLLSSFSVHKLAASLWMADRVSSVYRPSIHYHSVLIGDWFTTFWTSNWVTVVVMWRSWSKFLPKKNLVEFWLSKFVECEMRMPI